MGRKAIPRRSGVTPCCVDERQGYRRGKVVVCTRFEQENGRKPGTGAGKWSSVPDLSRKSDGNRVQEEEKCDLYPS